ncbi:MAG: quinate 5-dehydrogenase [Sulfobacillus acidophilus]|uniref:Quinate 5-dehydrogenase n=1 Tax=Sulfobacillus acidophilus TaxID=53633 RepID=A0A2T2WGF6_9FIRM|nr:MAG: quinate 5-dehydrogenase [Sulfobacillus acidophilus]
MKQVVSVSLGSHQRDHEAELTILGERVAVSRRGTDGDLDRAAAMIRALDGTVDAIGLGGIDRYLIVRDRRYEIEDARRLAQCATKTPVVDGSGVKNTLERDLVQQLHDEGIIRRSQTVLMVSAMDRFGMAEAFEALGYTLVAGDLIFSSRINYPIGSVDELAELARKLLPELARLPFQQLYPVGEDQITQSDPRFSHYFAQADIVAGDFHYIRRYMPDDLTNKVVITNTTTGGDVDRLEEAGVRLLVTTTPVVRGRSFGTNVIEAALVAVTGFLSDHPDWGQVVRQANLKGTRIALRPSRQESRP